MKSALLENFLLTRQGHLVNVDQNPYGAQCVELANDWCQTLGIESFPHTNAADFEFRSHPDCDWIDNTPSNVPGEGDIVVWAKSGALPAGHVAIFISGNVLSFTSFDENWPMGSAAHLQQHSYQGVAGWLHPRKLSSPGSLPTFPLAAVSFGTWLAQKRPDTIGKPALAVYGQYLKEAYPGRSDLQQNGRQPGDWLQQLLGEAIKETQT